MEATLTPAHARKSNFIEKLVSSKLFWVVAVSFLFSYPIYRSVYRTLPPELPILSTLPEYRFVDENGNTFGSRELKGKVYVANFMFTSCTTFCPKLLSEVQKVQHRMRGVIDRAAIVSFTVDPETDTSKILFARARELKAKPFVWRFLSSTVEETKKLLVEGFKVPVGNKEIAGSVMDVAHSNKLVLVDQNGNVRGYYDTDKDSVNQMMIDMGLLINRKKES